MNTVYLFNYLGVFLVSFYQYFVMFSMQILYMLLDLT